METECVNGKVCMVMLEAIGESEEENRNAVRLANMEFLESLKTEEKSLYYSLEANGNKVGIPNGMPGNNGVGVLVIGAGKRQYRNILRISHMVEDGTLKTDETLQEVFKGAKEGNGRLHLIGCFTNSMEEADMNHLYALLEYAKEAGVENCFIHGILDGEDAPHGVGLELTRELEDRLDESNYGKIASITGRKGVLDFTDTFATLEKYFKCLAFGDNKVPLSASEYIQIRYDLEEDNSIAPSLLDDDGMFQDGDHVILFNVRSGNSAILMHTLLFCDSNITPSERTTKIIEAVKFMDSIAKPNISVSSLVQYDDNTNYPVVVRPLPVNTTYVQMLGQAGKQQLRIAEESRFTHIKFLLNGAGDTEVPGDSTVMVHDRAEHTRDSLVESMESIASLTNTAMESGYYDMITLMLSAAGIVTQSKNVDLVKDMCQQVDRVLKNLAETAEKTGYTLVVVGTHAEATCVPENEDDKAPCNNVPCIIRPCQGQTLQRVELEEYSLENVAATCLKLVGVEAGEHMQPALI